MKKQLFKNLLIGALLPLGIQAQETGQANLLRDVKYKAAIETQFNVAYLNNKYGVSIDSNHVLYKIIQGKNLKLGLALANYKNTDAENKHITEIFSNYEEQFGRQLRSLTAMSFFNKQMAVVDSVKPLAEEQKQRLNNLFLNRVKISDESYGEIFKGALNRVSKDTAYYAALFSKEIDNKAKELTSNYTIKNQLSPRILNTMGNYIYAYQKSLLLVDYAIPKGSIDKQQLVDNIHNKYKPIIDSALIAAGTKLPGTRLAGLALQNQKILKISAQQAETLTSVCIAISKQKEIFLSQNPGGKYDSRYYEYEEVPKILSEEQYNKLLAIKFKKQAFDDAEEKWKELKKEGLDREGNPEQNLKQIQVYYLNRLIAKEKFAHAKDLQTAQVKSIDGEKPRILKKLESIQKNTNNKENLKSVLMW